MLQHSCNTLPVVYPSVTFKFSMSGFAIVILITLHLLNSIVGRNKIVQIQQEKQTLQREQKHWENVVFTKVNAI